MNAKEMVFKYSPHFLQNFVITLLNTYKYKKRQSGQYDYFKKYYSSLDNLSEQELLNEVNKKKNEFFKYVSEKSNWYRNYDFQDLKEVPVLEKKDIINNLDSIKTIEEKDGLISFTGGTTGTSMKVIYTKNDVQERHAILDSFRGQYGYKLGRKTAWFSGKNLITEKDISNKVCSHYDFINNIRFYSTFHINKNNFDVYWNSLKKFSPEFIIGFPSSVYNICEIADSRGLKLNGKIKVFFPTAETVLPEHRSLISKVLGCKIVNQYASSEGAPFIVECPEGNLHIHPLTGVFEVVSSDMEPSLTGEILVTSYTTKGTPLIRYRIGDSITLASKDEVCSCKTYFPLVKKIEGRSTDYILSPTYGKVNLGNISNSTKGVEGIIKFQMIQKKYDRVDISLVTTDKFNHNEERKFKDALMQRFGSELELYLNIVDDIANEKSGKFRIVKNLLGE
ncbi:phenylacetate--CoA ligase family protein [Psychrobacter faecalis]|uniref:phenylacetate--CoA ligase family protein n=1 Tax=Psychrobacter faecalis TaxID=180588 RepID=UPI001868DFCC|nr:phenylacetate--CoA ligase family protein [Psychrobacter faecalis]